MISCLLFLFVCVVWSSSIARGGRRVGTIAGMRGLVSGVRLCECPLPTSITKQLRSVYSHQLPCRSFVVSLYCLKGEWKTTASISLAGQDPSKTDPCLCGHFSIRSSWYKRYPNQKCPYIILCLSQGTCVQIFEENK